MPNPNLIHVKKKLPRDAAEALINAVMGQPSGHCMHESHDSDGTATVEYWIVWWPELDPPRCTWRVAQRCDLSAVRP